MKYDAIIIGAGPAGSAAGHVLASAGMRVAIVDKAIFPREKLCGGLLSERSEGIYKTIFDEPWDSAIEGISRGVAFYDRETFINNIADYGRIYFTSRINFDAHLSNLAQKRGAVLIQGTGLRSIDTDKREISLSDGRLLQTDFLIGADGVNSRVSKNLNLNQKGIRNLALGLELEIPYECLNHQPESPEIYFGVVRWGYGWVFPKRNAITIGIAGLLDRNPDLSRSFELFLRRLCKTMPNSKWKGHHIPFGNFNSRPGFKNFLLAGDAAGLVEPVTGEGIAFAMLSGKYAAEAVLQAASIGLPADAYGFYLRQYKQITDLLHQARLMRKLLFPRIPQSVFLKVVSRSKSKKVIKQYLDLLAGTIGYGDYAKFLFSSAAKRILPFF